MIFLYFLTRPEPRWGFGGSAGPTSGSDGKVYAMRPVSHHSAPLGLKKIVLESSMSGPIYD